MEGKESSVFAESQRLQAGGKGVLAHEQLNKRAGSREAEGRDSGSALWGLR